VSKDEAEAGGAIASKYRNAGQTRVCANRILMQDGIYDVFTKGLTDTAGAMKVEAHIADAVKKGAKVALGGKRSALGGTFFEPTVLTDVTTDLVITKEETPARWRRSTAWIPTRRRSRWPAMHPSFPPPARAGYGIHRSPTRSRPLDGGGLGWG
jgi:acyl-CoA reductase-like NAD-dependent aldehyde dehydrogenase